MDRGNMRTEIRRLLNDEKTPYKWSDAILNDRINIWHKKIVKATDILIKKQSYSAVQYQRKYIFPSSFLSISKKWKVTFDGEFIESLDIEREDVEFPGWRNQSSGSPKNYYYDETYSYLCLDPPPSSSADTSAINDAAGITADDTTITLDDTSDFDRQGSVIVDSEVIHYGYKSATELLLCERGMEGTTAAIHNDDAVVTKRDIIMFYNYEPDMLSSDENVPFNGLNQYEAYHLSIVHAVASMCLGTVPEKIELAIAQYGFYEREQKSLELDARHSKDNPQTFKLHPRYLDRR